MIAGIVTKDPQMQFGAWEYLSRHAVPKFGLRPACDHPMLGLGQVCRITDDVITVAWPVNVAPESFLIRAFDGVNIILFACIVALFFSCR